MLELYCLTMLIYLNVIGFDLALLGIFLFICPYLLIDQIYISAIKTDYIQVPYQLLIRDRGKRYFLQTNVKRNKRIDEILKQQLMKFTNYYAGGVIGTCKY